MTNQGPSLKRSFRRLDRRDSEDEEAVQPDEAARQSDCWQASIRHTHTHFVWIQFNTFTFFFLPFKSVHLTCFKVVVAI